MKQTINGGQQEVNQNKVQPIFQAVLKQYRLSFKCNQCRYILENPSIEDIIQHSFVCFDEIQKIQNRQQECSLIRENFDVIQINRNPQEKVEHILNNNQIKNSTKNIYKNYIQKFLHGLNNSSQIEAKDILDYIRQNQTNINLVNSLIFLRNQLNILFTNQQKEELNSFKKRAKISVKQNPHVSWDLELIQRFIDDLAHAKKGLMAFRIFILYQISARVSELSQITFGQIMQGRIRYIPLKQSKCGIKAERFFSIQEDVISIVKIFMERNTIDHSQSLNLGLSKSSVKTHSIINEFRTVKQEILDIHLIVHPIDQTYIHFLQKLKLHDLRYTSIQDLFNSGVNVGKIREYLGHSSIKITEKYLKNSSKICDVWGQKNQQGCMLQQKGLIIQFQGEKDLLE